LYNKKIIKKIISGFAKSNILVIGDTILDSFIWGSVNRISPEAPIPVVEVKRESFMPGGAANVVNNIRALGGQVSLISVIGEDFHGQTLKKELKKIGVDIKNCVSEKNRPTTLKTRVIAHNQQMVRVDKEIKEELSSSTIQKIIKATEKNIKKYDAIIIEDYGKGVVCSELLDAVINIALKNNKLILVDPKQNHFSLYKKATLITPNISEASQAANIEIKDKKSLYAVGKKIIKELEITAALITMGEKGMCLFQQKKDPINISTQTQAVYDVAGAGDTVIAVMGLALSAGADMKRAASIANLAAGVVVGKVGVATVNKKELEQKIKGATD
jgi:D-beta-D-heptose 7-phosphate kinase/D-beta-D-heptose 1-phosphate adenosyltransferase